MQCAAPMRIISRAEYRAMPWRNGRGTTHEIVREPDGAVDFAWRLSLADVPASGPFSPFPGYERIVVLVSGEGFGLDFGPRGSARLTSAARVAQFSGDWQTSCTLIGAPCSDLSWMVRRSDARAAVTLLELSTQGAHSFSHDAVGAFFCVSGGARLAAGEGREFALAEWDTALVGPTGARHWRLRPTAASTVIACLSAIPQDQDASSAGSGVTS
jgi:environmental stress-induced protein Ves